MSEASVSLAGSQQNLVPVTSRKAMWVSWGAAFSVIWSPKSAVTRLETGNVYFASDFLRNSSVSTWEWRDKTADSFLVISHNYSPVPITTNRDAWDIDATGFGFEQLEFDIR